MAGARDDARVRGLEAQLADARRRYEALRGRRAVRAALTLASAASRLRGAAGPAAATPAPLPAPAAEQGEDAGEVAHPWPLGHFYSPVPDTRELAREPARSRVWPPAPSETPGIDWREDEQVALVRDVFAEQDELVFPAGPTADRSEYHAGNEMFSPLDAWALGAMLRWLRPARMIEVGSGWSSLVAARVNREFLGGAMDLTCVEPYPPDFLAGGVDGITRLLDAPVQDVAPGRFAELEAGDVLFIDSSHVAKTGSDCNHLYHEVLPRLRTGVVVHVHDIFLPWDYPQEWVLSGRGWNEQYVLQAFLEFNGAFEVLLANAWMTRAHPQVLAQAVPGFPESTPGGGGSFWMRRA
jgi:hypothetical protein